MLKITITGAAATGKTTLALAIQALLRDHGFIVDNKDEDVVADEHSGYTVVHQHQGERMQAMRWQQVTIETVQIREDGATSIPSQLLAKFARYVNDRDMSNDDVGFQVGEDLREAGLLERT